MKIKFQTSKLRTLSVQVREKAEGTKYAIISIDYPDRFDAIALKKNPTHKSKHISLICFLQNMYEMLEADKEYLFSGFVSFGYGSTFLVLEDFIDASTGESWLDR